MDSGAKGAEMKSRNGAPQWSAAAARAGASVDRPNVPAARSGLSEASGLRSRPALALRWREGRTRQSRQPGEWPTARPIRPASRQAHRNVPLRIQAKAQAQVQVQVQVQMVMQMRVPVQAQVFALRVVQTLAKQRARRRPSIRFRR